MVDQNVPNTGLETVNTTLNNGNQIMSLLVRTIMAMFPRVAGTFTLGATAATAVAQNSVQANSIIIPFATNAAAGTLQGSAKALYVSALNPGVGFTVATASGGNATGSETYNYLLINPL